MPGQTASRAHCLCRAQKLHLLLIRIGVLASWLHQHSGHETELDSAPAMWNHTEDSNPRMGPASLRPITATSLPKERILYITAIRVRLTFLSPRGYVGTFLFFFKYYFNHPHILEGDGLRQPPAPAFFHNPLSPPLTSHSCHYPGTNFQS